MEAEYARRDGFFGGRYGTFKVKASVINDSENLVNEGDKPTIVSEVGYTEAKPDLSQDKLLSGRRATSRMSTSST